MPAPRIIDLTGKYDHLFKWMDNDFTKSLPDGNLLDQLDPSAESMSKGIKKGIEDVRTALLDQTNNDKKLSDEVKSSLEKLSKNKNIMK